MARADMAACRPFVGHWRMIAMELWTPDDLDLFGPAHLTLGRDGAGAGLDYRAVQRDRQPAIEFSFDGSDEGDRTTPVFAAHGRPPRRKSAPQTTMTR